MIKRTLLALSVAVVTVPSNAYQQSCAAIICLSAGGGNGPVCAAAVSAYYAIGSGWDDWSDIRKARSNWLNGCDMSNGSLMDVVLPPKYDLGEVDTTKNEKQLASLKKVIVHAVGRCDPHKLARKLNPGPDDPFTGEYDPRPPSLNAIPKRCLDYANHPLTYGVVLPEYRTNIDCKEVFSWGWGKTKKNVCESKWVVPETAVYDLDKADIQAIRAEAERFSKGGK